MCGKRIKGSRVLIRGGGQQYSKAVLGCKDNARYEMGVQKIVF